MFEMFYYSYTILLALFSLFIGLFFFQSYYTCILFLNYRLRKIRVLITEFIILVYIGLLALLIVSVIISRRYAYFDISFVSSAILVVAIFAILQIVISKIVKQKEYYFAVLVIILSSPLMICPFYGSYFLYLTIAILIFAYRLVYLLKEEKKRQKNELTEFSIKDGLDTLPAGVLYYDKEGYIYLINSKMKELIFKFLNKELKNGIGLLRSLEKCSMQGVQAQLIDEDILIRTPNEAWRFSKQEFISNNNTYIEVTAIDATESIGALDTLEEEREKLQKQNEEISVLSKNIEEIQKEKEFIRIRSQVHDVFSQRLTAIQRLSKTDELGDYYTSLLSLSKDAMNSIKRKQGGDPKELFGEIYHYYRRIGLSIELLDDMPQEDEIAFLFIAVLREACTNAIRHAKATKLFIKINKTDANYLIEITNNGQNPKKGLIEGGGLFGIRNRIENYGGSLKVEVIPEFCLVITINRKEENDKSIYS